MKLLYILNIANKVNNFSNASMRASLDLGIEFHIAGNWGYKSEEERHADEIKYGIRIHQIDFIRAPYHPGNYRAYKQLLELVKNEKYDILHCNTPIGGVLGRIVGAKSKTPSVIYQAHGFHFYDGAPLINWLIYYPIERYLAHYTDILITINQEDYDRARHFKLRNDGNIYFVPGVGIESDQFVKNISTRGIRRRELGLQDDDTMLISMGDIIKRKNYGSSIKAIARANNPNLKFFICGVGSEEKKINALAIKLGVQEQIKILGFRSDISELLNAADIFLSSTKQEGLPRSLMEAMASGLPCVASSIRGNIDLLEDGNGGFLCDLRNLQSFTEAIRKLASDKDSAKRMGYFNLEAIKKYDIHEVQKDIKALYSNIVE